MASPTHFYRYQTCARMDRLEPILLRHEIYFPTAAELNDPFDCQPRLAKASARDVARFMVRMFALKNPKASINARAEVFQQAILGIDTLGPDWVHAEMSRAFNEMSAKTRVLSLATRWNNMSMWAKYAADHTGYCLEFANVGGFTAAKPVVYGDVFNFDVTSPTAIVDSLEFTYRKTMDWANEEEYRLVGPSVAPSRLEIDPSWLTRIILGKDIKKPDRQTIQNWSRCRIPPLVVAEAKFDVVQRKLELV
jgi:hypothetical protein